MYSQFCYNMTCTPKSQHHTMQNCNKNHRAYEDNGVKAKHLKTLSMPGFFKLKCKLLSHVQLFATPWTIQSMEFFRPEYWSELPFPSPGDLPNPGSEPRSPTLQADYLPAEPQGKPKNTGVGSLSLLQRIFLTHELNQGLLNCRWILYQLSLFFLKEIKF